MTAEQEKQIAEIRAVDYHETSGVGKLLSIIDDLQKQQPKRYTEAELREECMSITRNRYSVLGNYGPLDERDFRSWLECARFLGMIKTEGEP